MIASIKNTLKTFFASRLSFDERHHDFMQLRAEIDRQSCEIQALEKTIDFYQNRINDLEKKLLYKPIYDTPPKPDKKKSKKIKK
jgi:uncharacterized coiled-coil DUF342 family protein